ncbi:hypothetical protein V2J09_002845 [Rumex salicifolius]
MNLLHFSYSSKSNPKPFLPALLTLIQITSLTFNYPIKTLAQSSLCRTSCAGIQINYPFGLGDGCGSLYYRHLLVCSFDVDTGGDTLQLRTPSGRYGVRQITYAPDPHLVVVDPSMWNCGDGVDYRRPRTQFSLDSSTHLTLSRQNDFLFFNCSNDDVIVGPRPLLCEQSPGRCASSCDSASYLCRHLPECASAVSRVGPACCSYYPKAAESLRLMMRHCSAYTSVYWKSGGVGDAVAPPPEYGVRVDFEIPVTGRCLDCEERRKGGGMCGFNTTSLDFQCLCEQGNVTTFCKDHQNKKTGGHAGAIAGTMSLVSVAGVVGVGGGIWYLRKMKATTPVTCGVQSNENRLF